LEDGGLSGVRFPNNEDSELDIWDTWEILLCSHGTQIGIRKTGQRGACGEFPIYLCVWMTNTGVVAQILHRDQLTADERSCTLMVMGYLTR
jgi:hypothetical protein